ncbi:MAG: serine hydrolase domain-containing protein [Pseudomonadota bacterium]
MSALSLTTRAVVAAWTTLAVAGCGGTGGSAASPAAAPTALTCQTATPFAGAPLHAAPPSSLFPATDLAAASLGPLPKELGVLLDQKVRDILQQTGAPAMTAAITIPGLGRWSSTQGLAQAIPPKPVNSDTEFYWGSVGKAFTAVLVLQLVEEGKLRLDDTLSRWYPQIPQAERITLAQLLTHTSGLPIHALGASGLGTETPAQQVAVLAQTPLLFCPGTHASYSNAGYVLLGLVVEAVEQRPFYQSVHHRIAAPLGLQHLRALRPGEDMPAALATPHAGRTPKADPGAWTRLGAGSVVARAEDMVVFWQAVLSGRLLAPATVQSQWTLLYQLFPTTTETNQGNRWFGMGVTLSEWTDSAGRARTWLGHGGHIPTADAVMLYDPAANAYAAVAVNSDVQSTPAANALLTTVMAWRAAH